MEIVAKELFEILLEFDKYLPRSIKLIAVGGTALTLLNKKSSTKDIDICFLNESEEKTFLKTAERLGYKIESARKLIGKNIVIDYYCKGYIFAVHLESDYFEKSVEITTMQKLELYSLNPIDLIITKTARLNQRDEEDIKTILSSYPINQKELVERYIKTMANSLVRDAKENILVLFSIIEKQMKIDQTALDIAKRWANERF
ncbi:MAG: nucleotidyltransferase [Candidatus Micrarchaeota archaeon]